MSQAGANSSAGSGASPIETLTGNSGGAVGPDAAFNIDVLGNNTTGIDVVGTPASNLITVIGLPSSETQVGTVELATAAETTTGTSTSLAVHPAGLNTKLGAQTSNGLIYGQGGAGSDLGALAEASDGELPIGSTGNPPVLSTLTAGTGISIANAAGSITISSTGGSSGSGQTIGATTDDIITLSLGATPSTYMIESRVSAFEGATPLGAGYKLFATFRTTGAAATLIGTVTSIIQEEGALSAAAATFVASGNNAILRVTGVAALTIEWDAIAAHTIGV